MMSMQKVHITYAIKLVNLNKVLGHESFIHKTTRPISTQIIMFSNLLGWITHKKYSTGTKKKKGIRLAIPMS